MKILKHSLFLIVSILFVQCSNPSPETSLHRAEYRGQTISLLLNDQGYLKELKDSILSNSNAHMKMMDDPGMMSSMMKNHGMMMNMMNQDSAMRQNMMSQMMTMMDTNSMMCGRMVQMMMGKPNVRSQLEKAFSNGHEAVQDKLDNDNHHAPLPKK